MQNKSSEQIENEIKEMQVRLHLARIREGKVSIVQEVKKRILECAPDIQNLDYILWPIRVSQGESGNNTRSNVSKIKWTDDKVAMLVQGRHQELIDNYGATYSSIASKANHCGYVFVFGQPLEKSE